MNELYKMNTTMGNTNQDKKQQEWTQQEGNMNNDNTINKINTS